MQGAPPPPPPPATSTPTGRCWGLQYGRAVDLMLVPTAVGTLPRRRRCRSTHVAGFTATRLFTSSGSATASPTSGPCVSLGPGGAAGRRSRSNSRMLSHADRGRQVHRLDRVTSGVVILARTKSAARRLSDQIKVSWQPPPLPPPKHVGAAGAGAGAAGAAGPGAGAGGGLTAVLLGRHANARVVLRLRPDTFPVPLKCEHPLSPALLKREGGGGGGAAERQSDSIGDL